MCEDEYELLLICGVCLSWGGDFDGNCVVGLLMFWVDCVLIGLICVVVMLVVDCINLLSGK